MATATNTEIIADLKKQVKALETEKKNQAAQMTDMMQQFEELKKTFLSQSVAKERVPLPSEEGVVKPTSNSDMVKIIHMVQMAPGLTTHAELQTTTIDLTIFGEERTLTVPQFEELIGKYRTWFDKGILAVSAESEQYAKRYMLETNKTYFLSSDFIKNLGDISMAQLNEVFPKLPLSHKEFVVSYWKQRMIEGDTRFTESFKLETLNRLTDGGFKTEILALATR